MPFDADEAAVSALREFSREVKATTDRAATIRFNPEDQLKRSVSKLVEEVGRMLGLNVSVFSESPVDDVGRPDLAIAAGGLLVGYAELKAPGEGTTYREFRGHNRSQFKKFMSLPNLIYTDARDWTIYRNGEREASLDVRLGDIDQVGDPDISGADAECVREMLRLFLGWEPIVPSNARQLAQVLAPSTRMLRTDVQESLAQAKPALTAIFDDWKRTLFPGAGELGRFRPERARRHNGRFHVRCGPE